MCRNECLSSASRGQTVTTEGEQSDAVLCCGARLLASYQPSTSADRSAPSLLGGFHRADEMAGIPFGGRLLRPVGPAVPPLKDVVA